jgi:nucleotide-binding universal stress UspA family protein
VKHVTAVLERDDESRPVSVDRQVLAAADAIAHLLTIDTETLPVRPGPAVDRADVVLQALAADDVAAAAMSARGPEPLCWDVIGQIAAPVVVVPRSSKQMMPKVSRVLLPMDGTAATAASVSGLAQRALDSGAHVVATHVFDPSTVPAFWDQAAYSGQEWTREFLRRNLPAGVELDLRSGRPAEEVVAEAERDDVDLIIIGWGQDLGAGRAATVRHALTQGRVPVLLVRCGEEALSRP